MAFFQRLSFLIIVLFLLIGGVSALSAQVQSVSNGQELVIYKTSTDDRIKVIKASKVDKMTKYYIVEEASEQRAKTTIEETLLIKRLKLAPEGAEGPADDEVDKIRADFESAMGSYSDIKSSLEPHLIAWQEFQKNRQRRAAEALQLRLNKFLSVQYDVNTNYEKMTVEERIAEGKALTPLLPDQSQVIAVYLKPWEGELVAMGEGKVKYQGKWMTRQEVSELTAKPIEEAPKPEPTKLPLETMGNVSINGGMVIVIAIVAGASALMLIFCAIMGVIRQLSGVDMVGMLCILMGIAGVAVYGYFFTFYSIEPDEYQYVSSKLPDGYTKSAFEEMLDNMASNNKYVPDRFRKKQKVSIGEAEINDFIKRAVQIEDKNPDDKYAIRRTGYVVKLMPRKIVLFEPSKVMGKDIMVSYKIDYTVEKDGFHFNDCTVFIGKAQLPNKFGAYFWYPNELIIRKIVRRLGMPDSFRMVDMTEDGLVFQK